MAWINSNQKGYINTDFILRVAIESDMAGAQWFIMGHLAIRDLPLGEEPSITLRGPYDNQQDAEDRLGLLLKDSIQSGVV